MTVKAAISSGQPRTTFATPSKTTWPGKKQWQLDDKSGDVRHRKYQSQLRCHPHQPSVLAQPVGSPTAAPMMKPTSGLRMTTLSRDHSQGAVVEDAGQEDVLRASGAGGNQNGDSRWDDRLGDVLDRLPLNETDRGQHQRGANRSADSRVELRPMTQAMVKATNGNADSTMPRAPPRDSPSW